MSMNISCGTTWALKGRYICIHIPLNSFSQLYLLEQREGGLLSLCINFNVDSPVPLTILATLDLITKTYNNVPLETLLISDHY